MSFQELVILLPCHSLDDFPVYHQGDDAQSLLASWSALWHPELIHAAGKLPSWKRVDDPPANCEGMFLVVPTIGVGDLPTGFSRRAVDEGGCLVSQGMDRIEIANHGLEHLGEAVNHDLNSDYVLDFFALGYCYLQIQLLTRHMRYSSNLDQVFFESQVVAAANAAHVDDRDTFYEKLQACFDVLAEERDHFYPVDAFLLDLTLVAGATTGKPLVEELEQTTPSNLLIPGHVIRQLAENEPETISVLKRVIDEEGVELIGGETHEQRLVLLANESIRAELQRGLNDYEQVLDYRPTVYGRRRFGLTANLPSVLTGLGFKGALHATLDDGRFPEGLTIRVRWEGATEQTVDAYAKVPFDASLPETFLNLAIKMGEQMDMDHVATVCFAHWPGRHAVWYDDLRRAASYSGAMGTFSRFTPFFEQAEDPGHNDRFKADQYRSPFLTQAVAHNEPNPISRSIRYWREQATLRAAQAIDFLAASISGQAPQLNSVDSDWLRITERCEEPTALDDDPKSAQPKTAQPSTDKPNPAAEHVANQEGNASGEQSPQGGKRGPVGFAEDALQEALSKFAEQLPREAHTRPGYLVANPCSFVRRMGLTLDRLEGVPEIARPIYSADVDGDEVQVVVDVPAMGFAWVAGEGRGSRPSAKRKAIKLAEEYLLRNEYCEVAIDPDSGSIRSIHEYNARKVRMSQQLAFRYGKRDRDDEESDYSRMVADEIRTVRDSTTCGQIESTGRLVDDQDEVIAEFKQTMTIWRGSRVIELDIELDPKREPDSNPWSSYYASRFAWRDEAADVWCGVNQHRQHVSVSRFEAPEYIEVEFDEKSTTILTGGVPFHRKAKMNIVDSLLLVHGEQQRHFKMGIGLDLTHPPQAAEALVAPKTTFFQHAGAPSPAPSSWLFHIDAKNVTASSWTLAGPAEAGQDGRRFYVRLIETMGRETTAHLQAFRPIKSAQIVDLMGCPLKPCEIKEGRAVIPVLSHQYIQVEVVF